MFFYIKNIISKLYLIKKKWKRFKITLLITLFLLFVFSHIYCFLFFFNCIRLYQNFGYFYSKVVIIRMKLVMFSFLICCFTFVYIHYYRCLMAIKRNNFTPPTLGLWDHPHHTEYKRDEKRKINIFYFNFSEWGKNESISPTVLVRNQNVRNFSILLHSIWTGN